MNPFRIEYADHIICYQEELNMWDIYLPQEGSTRGEGIGRKASLKGAKEYLDRKAKHVVKFPSHKAFLLDWGSSISEVTVTGNVPKGGPRDKVEVWIKDATGKRMKKRVDELREHSPMSMTLLGRITELRGEIEALVTTANSLRDQMTSYKPLDILPEPELP